MSAAVAHNRIAPHLDTPTAPPKLPSDPAGRERALADAVFAAVLALQAQLAHPEVVMRAAAMILDLEKTRLRHGREVVGTAERTPHPPGAASDEPHPEGAGYNLADPFEVYVTQVQKMLQSWEDEDGFDIRISRDEARQYARELMAKEQTQKATAVPPPTPSPAAARE